MSPASFKLLATKNSKCKKDCVFRLSISEQQKHIYELFCASISRTTYLERKLDDLENKVNLFR